MMILSCFWFCLSSPDDRLFAAIFAVGSMQNNAWSYSQFSSTSRAELRQLIAKQTAMRSKAFTSSLIAATVIDRHQPEKQWQAAT